MRNTIIIAAISLVLVSCSKNKFTTKPQVKFKESSSDAYTKGSDIEFILSFTDAEGDFPGKIFIQRLSADCPSDTMFKETRFLPEFPTSSNFEGDIKLLYSLGTNNGTTPGIMTEPPYDLCGDTLACYFRFAIEDKAGNKSDTVASQTIFLVK